MTELRSLNYTVTDKHPEQTEARILRVLAGLHPMQPMAKRRLSQIVQGTDLARAGQTYSALGRLNNKKLIVEPLRGFWKINDAGRAALALYDELNDGGNAA